jgi:hypothetical protein
MKQFSQLAKQISDFHKAKSKPDGTADEAAGMVNNSMEDSAAHEKMASIQAEHHAKCPGCGHSGMVHDFIAKKPAGKPTEFAE